VEHQQILEPNRPLDFGSGFYTTTSQKQAERWTRARMEQAKVNHGYINIYEYTVVKGFATRRFRSANEPWVDFVHANRTVQGYNHNYDIVIGPVANDNVYLSFNLYESGIITKQDLIRRLKTYKLVDQLLFHSEQSLKTLKYVGNKEVRP
jgi:hypothetical protein